MKKELAVKIRSLLNSGDAAAVIFLSGDDEDLKPVTAVDADDTSIESIYTGDRRFPVSGFACMVQPHYEGKVAVVMRECDRRMLVELAKHNKIDFDSVLPVGIPCSQELADECVCDHPVPPGCEFSTDTKPVEPETGDDEIGEDRLAYWMGHFSRCIRCLGCRNVCPLCYCNDCILDNEDIIGPDVFPPDIPLFHLARAIDMADRCVDCGMCEEVCPADIPLRKLYRIVLKSMSEALDYIPGIDLNEKSPLEVLGEPSNLGGMEEGFRAD